jgi:arsenate reductase (thioredoxin)
MIRVLFVDVRNATRSPIAEAWFNHLAGDRAQARSCGTLPAKHVWGRATQVMAELGIDLRHESSKSITPKLLDRADRIVIMGSGIFPRADVSTRVWNFDDPTGKPLEEVHCLRDQICQRVDKLVTEILAEESSLQEFEWQKLVLFNYERIWN